MNNKISSIILLVLMMSNNSSPADDYVVKFSVPPFSPFNSFAERADCTGASVLAVQEITKALNIKSKLAYYPYARIFNSLKIGELDLALTFKNSTNANDIEYIGPLSLSEIIVITKNNMPLRHYADLHQLKRIAVIRRAQVNEQFDQDNTLNKFNVNNYSQAVAMLKLNRVDAVIGSKVGIEYALRQQGMDSTLTANALKLGTQEWGLHVSKKSPLMARLPTLRAAVKNAYQADLIYQLYQQQIKHCLPAK